MSGLNPSHKVVWFSPDFIELGLRRDFYADFMRRFAHLNLGRGPIEGVWKAFTLAQLDIGGWRSQRFKGVKLETLRLVVERVGQTFGPNSYTDAYEQLSQRLVVPPVIDFLATINT